MIQYSCHDTFGSTRPQRGKHWRIWVCVLNAYVFGWLEYQCSHWSIYRWVTAKITAWRFSARIIMKAKILKQPRWETQVANTLRWLYTWKRSILCMQVGEWPYTYLYSEVINQYICNGKLENLLRFNKNIVVSITIEIMKTKIFQQHEVGKTWVANTLRCRVGAGWVHPPLGAAPK